MPRNGRSMGFFSDDAARSTCTAVIGSMTQAMRAAVVKVSSAKSTGGCAYGVDFPCTQMSNATTVLNRAGVRVREYLKG